MSIESSIALNVNVGQGGLGLSSVTHGDTIYANALNGFTVLPAAAENNVLLSGTTPSWGKINLDSDVVTGTLAVANGGTNFGTTPTDGQVMIGNGTGYALSNLTAGSNVTITNGPGTITIAATASSSGFTPTEYTTPGTYTYDIPAGAKFLDVVMVGAGSGGTGASKNSNFPSGTGGSAGITRFLKIAVAGATTASVTVGAGSSGTSGSNSNSNISSSSAGGISDIAIGGKTIVAAAGGGSTGPDSSTGRVGASGGSAGAQSGGNASGTTAGTAGSATPAGSTNYTVSVAGVAGATGITTGVVSGINGNNGGNLLQSYYILGGTGSTGSRGVGGGVTGGIGGSCQGAVYTGQQALGVLQWGGGGSGGCSGLGQGGMGAHRDADAQPGEIGAGGGGGCSTSATVGTFTESRLNGAAGGPGYVFIQPI